jgi:hypothetical protein
MTDAKTEADTEVPGSARKEPDFVASMAGVVDAALGVGVSLARVMAEATSTGRSVPAMPEGTPAILAIVRYGVSAMGNVAQAVIEGTQSLGKRKAGGPGAAAASKASSAGAKSATKSVGPRVQAGSSLRVPLSVENPAEKAMLGLRPQLRGIFHLGQDASKRLPAPTFEPAELNVAPHDFEKLVVRLDVPVDAPPGVYELILALGDDEPDLPMSFQVMPPA